jgi:Uma2 family endonuclease
MASPATKPKFAYTVDQYLAIERGTPERYYYLDGEIYGMAGESPAHADISANIVILLGTQLRNTPCRVRTKDTKVRSSHILTAGTSTRGLFSYPDVVVICGEPQYHDEVKDVVLNPKVIVEVLSESTEAFDRGEKFLRLQRGNPSLTDYILASQDRPQLEQFTRQTDEKWTYEIVTGLHSSLAIPSIKCILKLAEVYERVRFPEEPPTTPVTPS